MKDKPLFFRCFAKSLLISLLLWGVAMGAMLWLNFRWSETDIISQQHALPNAIAQGETKFTLPTPSEKGYLTWQKDETSVMLTMNSSDTLKKYGGQFFVRVYDEEGERLGQSQMLAGYSSIFQEDGTADGYCLLFDPVLTDEQQIEIARILNRSSDQHSFRIGEERNGAQLDRIELTGWKEGEVIYVRTLILLYGEERVVLVDSDADLFPGSAPQAFQAYDVEFFSALTGRGGPGKRLEQYRTMEAEVDSAEADNPRWMLGQSSIVYYGGGNARLWDTGEQPVASNYCLPGDYLLAGLEPAALVTLGAAVALALFTAWLETRAIRRERAFVRGAAHELKTPLAVLRTHAEALREDIDPSKRQEYLGIVVEESDRMAALVGSLMDLAKLESGGRLQREPLDLTALVENCAARLTLPVEQKGLRLVTRLDPAAVLGEKLRLEEMVDNLADNALRHCASGGTVTIALTQKGRDVRLTVDNDGDPVPPEQLDRLFEPFYRGDQGRSRTDGGAGLGLAMVRATVTAHGGRCWAVNRTGGVTFEVRLPGLQSGQ